MWKHHDREDHYKVLQSSDVLMFHGDCFHAGAENDTKRSSIAMYVPVGFRPSNTFNCALREINL